MLFQLPVSALLLALAVLGEASSHGRGAHLAHMRRRPLNPRVPQPQAPAEPPTRSLSRRSCRKKSSSTSLASSTKPAATIVNVAPAPSTSAKDEAPPTTSTQKAAPPATTKDSGSSSSPTSGPAAGFEPVKPSDWPTATQVGLQPTSTVASKQDPYLEELSKAIDYSSYDVFTEEHNGQMTYYGQGLGACGDVYDDQSFTAAVSHLMFDAWLGADTDAQNRNPICGPFVPGRQAIETAGLVTAVKSAVPGHALLGGDGLLNCVGSAAAQCHVPLTATVTHGDKSIQVRIVDRCAACLEDDIDLTPAAFAALADMSLGRTSVSWKFNKW